MNADADGSFISVLFSCEMRVMIVKALVFLFSAVLCFMYSLFIGSVGTAAQSELKRLSDHGNKKAFRALRFAVNEEKYINYSRFGLCFSGTVFIVSGLLLAAVPLSQILCSAFAAQSEILICSLSAAAVFLVLLFALFLCGFLLPEKLGAIGAEKTLSAMPGLFGFLNALMMPLPAFSDLLSGIMLRSSEKNAKNDTNRRAEEEILQMVDEGEENGVIEGNTKDMIENVFEFDDTTVGEIMTHRKDVVAVKLGTKITDAAKTAIESGKSRLPVYGDDIDDIEGILYVKDLLEYVSTDAPDEIIGKDMIKEAVFVPESKSCSEMFEYMTEKKTQIAVVVDEFGGTGGIITMEDLIESIVGNIQDEYDNEAEEISQLDERSFTVSGSTSLDEISTLTGLVFDDEENDTVAGIMLDRMGHIPKNGEHPSIVINGTRFTVQQVDDRRITKVLVVKARHQAEE